MTDLMLTKSTDPSGHERIFVRFGILANTYKVELTGTVYARAYDYPAELPILVEALVTGVFNGKIYEDLPTEEEDYLGTLYRVMQNVN